MKNLEKPFAANRDDYIMNLLDVNNKDKILNLGVANIPSLESRTEKIAKEVTTLDLDTDKIGKAKKFLKRTKLIKCNVEKEEFPKDNYYTKSTALEILEHLKKDDLVLKKLNKALKINGSLIVSVPNKNFWHIINPVKYSQHKRHYSNQDIIEKLEKSGFKIEHFNLVENWTLLANVYIHAFYKYLLKKQKEFGFFKKSPAKTYHQKNKKGLDIVIKARKIKNI